MSTHQLTAIHHAANLTRRVGVVLGRISGLNPRQQALADEAASHLHHAGIAITAITVLARTQTAVAA